VLEGNERLGSGVQRKKRTNENTGYSISGNCS
jgi:hypothetical protein